MWVEMRITTGPPLGAEGERTTITQSLWRAMTTSEGLREQRPGLVFLLTTTQIPSTAKQLLCPGEGLLGNPSINSKGDITGLTISLPFYPNFRGKKITVLWREGYVHFCRRAVHGCRPGLHPSCTPTQFRLGWPEGSSEASSSYVKTLRHYINYLF